MCCVDEFQHRIYAEPAMTAMDRRRIWREIEKIYMPWRDYLTLCRAGGTTGYFDLLSLAGIPNPFAEGVVRKCVGHVIEEIMDRYQ